MKTLTPPAIRREGRSRRRINGEIREMENKKVFICFCSAQEQYECGGLGCHQCPGAWLREESDVPEDAVKLNLPDTYWVESDHL